MEQKRLVVVCGVVLMVLSAVASARQPQSDPISGRWGQGQTALMDITFDGKRAVSGTIFVINPSGTASAPIRTGSFDPSSGALSLAGEVKAPDGRIVPYLLTGKLKGGALAMTYEFGEDKGTASLTRLAPASSAIPPARSAAPAPAAVDSSATLRKHFAEVSALVVKAAELVPADKYSYRPTDGVRTFGELISHIADSYGYYCGAPGGQHAGGSAGPGQGGADKATTTARLQNASAACTAPAKALDAEAWIGNIAHTNLHYGNIVTYMRMLGLVPPSS